MKNDTIPLKNYLSIFKSRLTLETKIENSEIIGFIECLDKFIEKFGEYEERLTKLESRKKIPSNQSNNSFVLGVQSKIEILKNIVKSKMGNTDEDMFSFNLITIETIEEEIKQSNTVTKVQLEKLNKIYLSEKGQI